MKKLAHLKGAKLLSKNAQRSINGGGGCNGVNHCEIGGAPCPSDKICVYGPCGYECVPDLGGGDPPIL